MEHLANSYSKMLRNMWLIQMYSAALTSNLIDHTRSSILGCRCQAFQGS